jgi:hypothetical protein
MADHEPTTNDELLARVVQTLREPVALRADFESRVMQDVRATPATRAFVPSRPRLVDWIVRPRTVRISPLGGLAVAAGIAAVALLIPRLAPVERAQRAPAVAAVPETIPVAPASRPVNAEQAVQFVLVAPDARSVTLAGSFNSWDTAATRLRREAGGVWTVQLPLRPGRYAYSFVVDGREWRADPAAPRTVDDDFGRPSSVLTVAPGLRERP